MNETIQKLRDYASLKNDWYINRAIKHTRKTDSFRNNKSRNKPSNRTKKLYKQIKLNKMKVKTRLINC